MKKLIKVSSVSPYVVVGNVSKNTKIILDGLSALKEGCHNDSAVIVFPELCLTGYTLGDMFFDQGLQDEIDKSLHEIVSYSRSMSSIIIVGAPIRSNGALYNCAVAIRKGSVLAVVPKTSIPNYKEFYEARWFASGRNIKGQTLTICDQKVPFGVDVLIYDNKSKDICLSIEICEDLWMPISPSLYQTVAGATIVANLSASNEIIGKSEYRRDLVRMQSAKTVSAYMYASCGQGESSTDVLFSGHCIIADNGKIRCERRDFEASTSSVSAIIDVSALVLDRTVTTTFSQELQDLQHVSFRSVYTDFERALPQEYAQSLDKYPLLPKSDKDCEEMLNIMAHSLETRMVNTDIRSLVLGLSGGLDSALAAMVAIRAYKLMGMIGEGVKPLFTCVSMPSYATSDDTKSFARVLGEALNADFREVPIKKGFMQMLKDIGHDGVTQDLTYENAQARYRTNLLFDIANMNKALVLGTGDLSEIALGWCTFGGDHLSSYNVNASVSKTAVKELVRYVANTPEYADTSIGETLRSILGNVVSPELTGGGGKISQSTEDILGPYVIHDFVLHRFVRWHEDYNTIVFYAKQIFEKDFNESLIEKTVQTFFRRFTQNQFKRSSMPDGPKVGSVALSPRGDWRMPSDLDLK